MFWQSCDGVDGKDFGEETWSVRTSFPVYIMAAASIIGWLTFIVFGSFGLVALPLDFVRDFFSRPKQTITKSEYLRRAKQVGGWQWVLSTVLARNTGILW